MILIVGPPGSGKTPLCSMLGKAYTRKTGLPAIVVTDIPKKVDGLNRCVKLSMKAVKAFRNAMLIYDDARNTLGYDEKIIEALVTKDVMRQHHKAIYVCVYHTFRDIPSEIKAAAHAVYVVKTGERPAAAQTVFLRDACERATDQWQYFKK